MIAQVVLNNAQIMNIWIQQIIRDNVLNIVNMLLIYQVEHVYIILEIVHLLIH